MGMPSHMGEEGWDFKLRAQKGRFLVPYAPPEFRIFRVQNSRIFWIFECSKFSLLSKLSITRRTCQNFKLSCVAQGFEISGQSLRPFQASPRKSACAIETASESTNYQQLALKKYINMSVILKAYCLFSLKNLVWREEQEKGYLINMYSLPEAREA